MTATWRVLALASAMIAPVTTACPVAPGGTLVQGEQLSLAFALIPPRPAVGEHFTVSMTLCDASGRPVDGNVSVDALMPAHSHGMNYAPQVASKGRGRYQAQGMMMHMPGHWQLVFGLRSALHRERITVDYRLD